MSESDLQESKMPHPDTPDTLNTKSKFKDDNVTDKPSTSLVLYKTPRVYDVPLTRNMSSIPFESRMSSDSNAFYDPNYFGRCLIKQATISFSSEGLFPVVISMRPCSTCPNWVEVTTTVQVDPGNQCVGCVFEKYGAHAKK